MHVASITAPPVSRSAGTPIVQTLLPIVSVVFVAYLVIGMAMPVLPLYVHDGLGFGVFVVGLVAGAQFAVSLLSRFFAGHRADDHGAKQTVTIGLFLAASAGVSYVLSATSFSHAVLSLSALMLGRAVLGGAASFIVAGAFVWGLGLVGLRNAGMVMAWVGAPMYVAYALGAPIGSLLYDKLGFVAIAVGTIALPLVAIAVITRLKAVITTRPAAVDMRSVVRAIALPGLGVAFSSIGLGTVSTFAALLFAHRGWSASWLAFTAMSVAFVAARIAFGHLPDKLGGARVAIVFGVVEAAGQALMWLATTPTLAIAGAALTGFGYALVYPGLGTEAVRRAPAQSRGLASATYTACLDIALGVGNPALGLIASAWGLAAVFGAGALLVVGSIVVAVLVLNSSLKGVWA